MDADAGGAAHYSADRRVFQVDPEAAQSLLLNEIMWSITATLLDGAHMDEFDVDAALRLAFGPDVISQTFGAAPGGRPSDFMSDPGGFGGFLGVPDDDRIPVATLSKIDCCISLREALNGVGRAAPAFGHTAPDPGMTITRLNPATRCPPDAGRVIGTGFEDQQPKDAAVVSGSTRAHIVPRTWSEPRLDAFASGAYQ